VLNGGLIADKKGDCYVAVEQKKMVKNEEKSY